MACMAQAAEMRLGGSVPERFTPAEAARMVARTVAVDAVGLEERAGSLAKRSIKRDAKLWALDLAIRSIDLTTLEGTDTAGKIVAMCAKAVRPNPVDPSIPSVAAVCLYPHLVPVAVGQLKGTSVKVASVAGGFRSGLGPLDARLREVREVVELGAHEVDIVLNRSLFLGGRYAQAFEELVATYQHLVFGVAVRMLGNAAEAEEIAQEAFLRAHRALADFRGDAKLSTWLYAIVSRLCLTRLASGERRMARQGEETLMRLANTEGDPAAAVERSEVEAALHRAIAELPEERRIVVVLRDLEGLSYEEIAQTLELELGTVRSRLHRARMDLKDKMERFLR